MNLPNSVHNRLSYAGAVIAGLALIVFGFLFFLHSVTDTARAPYASLLIFVLVPAVLVFGLALIPLGMLRERRHVRRTGEQSIPRLPVLDMNDPRQRNMVVIVAIGSVFLLFLTVFGSFQAYEATESVAFCGATCHTVMAPEYVTYQSSPHARVKCVECHVGPGAEWYVKSKMSGLYQVYAVLFDKYPRPITGPISSLRPAQETCEQCHWPDHFFQAQQRRIDHFLPDEQNTRWEIDLLIKTGGGKPGALETGGIHWHMNINNRVEYIATDAQRQQIPWVRMTDRTTGRVTEFMSTENPLSKEDIAHAALRKMDCMDCHNRPSHTFRSPAESINRALAAGKIDSTLPFIKKTAVEALTAEYASSDAASQGIANAVSRFYEKNYPALVASRHDTIIDAIGEVQAIYARSFFPLMKARWDEYPNNIGHFMFAGCGRCHDGKHQTSDGKLISNDCHTCHTITAQGKPDAMTFAGDRNGLAFEHPEEIGTLWQEMPCSSCHKGAIP